MTVARVLEEARSKMKKEKADRQKGELDSFPIPLVRVSDKYDRVGRRFTT
jgi:hypothetical protein